MLARLQRVIREHPKRALIIILSMLFLIHRRVKSLRQHIRLDDEKAAARKKSQEARAVDPRPLIAFSGSLCLVSYYNGVVAYLKDHFDLRDIRVSGVSGGCVAFFPLLLDIPANKCLSLFMYAVTKIVQRPLKFYLMKESDMRKVVVQELKIHGVSEGNVKELYKQNRVFMGVTACKWLGGLLPTPSARVLPMADNLNAVIKQMLHSMCTLPFFRRLGRLPDGSACGDGNFSMMYAIPDDVDAEKLVRITPWCFLPADVKPSKYSKMHFVDAFFPTGPRAQIDDQFCVGYQTAWDHHEVFVKKGLKPKPYSTNPQALLQEHVAAFRDMANLRPTSENGSGSGSTDEDVGKTVVTPKAAPPMLHRPHSTTKLLHSVITDYKLGRDRGPRAASAVFTHGNKIGGHRVTADSDFDCTMQHANSIWKVTNLENADQELGTRASV